MCCSCYYERLMNWFWVRQNSIANGNYQLTERQIQQKKYNLKTHILCVCVEVNVIAQASTYVVPFSPSPSPLRRWRDQFFFLSFKAINIYWKYCHTIVFFFCSLHEIFFMRAGFFFLRVIWSDISLHKLNVSFHRSNLDNQLLSSHCLVISHAYIMSSFKVGLNIFFFVFIFFIETLFSKNHVHIFKLTYAMRDL